MTKGLKALLIVSLISLPFWWGINVLEKSLEDFFLSQYYQPSLSARILPLPAVPAKSQVFEINAKSAISVKLGLNGETQILFEKDPSRVLPIASLSKLMTAWVVFEYPEKYDLSRKIEISERAIAKEGNFGLIQGQEVPIKDLLYSMLIESSNDAAYALAEVIGDPEEFVSLMNLEAKEKLGLKNTYFITPSGLEVENERGLLTNYSGVGDLVKLSQNILCRHPEIFEISTIQSAPIFNGYLAVNKNEILTDGRVVGAKTGWTPVAGGCILSVVKDGEKYIVNVILGTDSPDSRFTEMRELMEIVQ